MPPSTADVLVRLEHVTCAYDGPPVLVDVDLTVRGGAFVGVVGPSGAGKTTLLRAMVGGVPRIAGTVTVAGRPARFGTTSAVGWVPQLETVDWQFPATVREIVAMGLWTGSRWRPWTSPDEARRIDVLLERLGLAGLGRRHIRDLSGGQQQRVFLARALVGRPELLLLDEPTSGVDIKTRDDILHLLAELNGEGITVVLTTHELNALAAHLPWVVCVNRQVIAEGPPEHVFTDEVLSRTYGADLRVYRHDGTILVADAAPHRFRDALRHRHDGYEHAHHEHEPHDHGEPGADHVHASRGPAPG